MIQISQMEGVDGADFVLLSPRLVIMEGQFVSLANVLNEHCEEAIFTVGFCLGVKKDLGKVFAWHRDGGMSEIGNFAQGTR